MREAVIENLCKVWAENNDWLTYKFTSPSNRSVPDRVFVKDGRFVFVEFKAPGKKPTKLQQRTIDKIREKGAEVLVIDDVEKFKELLSC